MAHVYAINSSGNKGLKPVSITGNLGTAKTNYRVGETFDPTGIELMVQYEGGYELSVSPSVLVWNLSSLNTEGTFDLTGVYTENRQSVSITFENAITVARVVKQIPTFPAYTYTGSPITVEPNNYDQDAYTMTGDTVVTNAGSYSVTFALKEGYKWSDGTLTNKTVNYTVAKKTVNAPTIRLGGSAVTSVVYTGSSVAATVVFSGTTPEYTLSGDTSKTSVGNYTLTVTLGNNYQFSGGSATKNLSWSITGATVTVNKLYDHDATVDASPTKISQVEFRGINNTLIDPTSPSITSSNPDVTVTMTKVSTGVYDITASATVSGNFTYTITGTKTNYLNISHTSKQYTMSLIPAKDTLENTSWSDIKKVIDAGQAANYWSVGDRKTVTLNGTCGSCTFSNTSVGVKILGFNHNKSIETGNKNSIHFQFGYMSSKDVAFCDSGYNSSKTSGSWFNMNNSDSNSGGWKSSLMRTSRVGQFLNCIPEDLRNLISTITKHTVDSAKSSGYKDDTTQDQIFLLSEYEVQGANTYSRAHTNQLQYDYYKNGNSKIKYKHNGTSTKCYWWCRDPGFYSSNTTYFFCGVSTDGSAISYYAHYSYGFAPAFCIQSA